MLSLILAFEAALIARSDRVNLTLKLARIFRGFKLFLFVVLAIIFTFEFGEIRSLALLFSLRESLVGAVVWESSRSFSKGWKSIVVVVLIF
jgi:hypothetical protein